MPILTSNIWNRVFRVTAGTRFGTGFAVESDSGAQFLVTARHVIDGVAGPITLEAVGAVHEVPLDLVEGVPSAADIAVIRLEQPLARVLPTTFNSDGSVFSQDVFFLGYPYGLAMTAHGVDQMPFVKKATLSAQDLSEDVRILYLDGMNNPGFSGGPVAFYNSAGQPHILGVISGYRISPDELIVRGQLVEDAVVRANSGIIIAHDIRHAMDAIRESEVGAEAAAKLP